MYCFVEVCPVGKKKFNTCAIKVTSKDPKVYDYLEHNHCHLFTFGHSIFHEVMPGCDLIRKSLYKYIIFLKFIKLQ